MKEGKVTQQFLILTEMMCWPKDGKWNNINPFHKATREKVEQNLESAKRVYADIFNYGYVSSWVMKQAEEIGILKVDCTLTELGLKQKDILLALKDHRIKPIPNYQELQEFRM